MTSALVVAKAPVPGLVKTRLAATVGDRAAAELAAAALLDTIEACSGAFGARRCSLALVGDLTVAQEGKLLLSRLEGWTVFRQEGRRFADRLEHAHRTAFARTAGPVIQVGMDTPQATAEDLRALVTGMQGHDALLAPAEDGGWWALGVDDPSLLRGLGDVPMSTPGTDGSTRRLLRANGALVAVGSRLCDVDDAVDAARVAAEAPWTRFARCWAHTSREEVTP
ncbi:TIGR04282 family arsenosugar biosynthesis glycosyltransferase [Janibacter alittae]|uniref:DUF2064 domain-containing protein n=1 Tax=Janibacter alittae TaxID=3115209 RepID=A0ABZ2ML23_9MICO